MDNPNGRAELDHWSSALVAAKYTVVFESQRDRWLTTPRRKEAREPTLAFQRIEPRGEKKGIDYPLENSVKQSQAGHLESRISPDEA